MTIELSREIGSRTSDITANVVADRIATEVRQAGSGQPKYAKVTSLLQAFRTTEGHSRISDIIRLLQEREIGVDSGWTSEAGTPSIRRPGVLKLSASDHAPSAPTSSVEDPAIRVSVWGSGGVCHAQPLTDFIERPRDGDVLWFDVDPPTLDTAAGHDELVKSTISERASHVAARLERWCPGLDEEMLHDLLRQDVQPKVETYTDERDCLRGVSVVAVIAQELPGEPGDSDGVSQRLIFELVEIVVGEGWMVTCWHPGRVVSGATSDEEKISLLKESFIRSVEHRWLNDETLTSNSKTSGDLGIYLARALTHTYGASNRMIEQWIADWEADFYSALTQKDKSKRLREAAAEISNLLSMVGEFRRRAKAFSHARYATQDRTWFPELSDRGLGVHAQSEQAEALAKAVTSAEEKCGLMSNDVRGYMDLLMLQSSATQQESAERLQSYLGKVTGLVLVPTLVAGLFGANTQLPGRDSWVGFDTMLVLMLLSAVAVYFVMRKLID